MKQTLLNSAGALALAVAFASSAALATDSNEVKQYDYNTAVQDFANGSNNGNGTRNDLYSHNDDDGLDLDANVNNAFNDESKDDDDGLDLDYYSRSVDWDRSTNNEDGSHNVSIDKSLEIDGVAILVSTQRLEAAAAEVEMYTAKGNLKTGGVSYGQGANTMGAGNMTTSNNTGAGTIAQAASGIQANGTFSIR